jgi:hypothetical protein
MISEEVQSAYGPRPIKPFDMCYFYYSIASAVGTYIGRAVHTELESDYKILAVNLPNLWQDKWSNLSFVKSGLAELYIRQVENDSIPEGTEFDLGFACSVASRAINTEVIAALQDSALETPTRGSEGFDRWLEGFTS